MTLLFMNYYYGRFIKKRIDILNGVSRFFNYMSGVFVVLLIFGLFSQAFASEPQPVAPVAVKEELSEGKTEIVIELDPYYTAIALDIPLTGAPIPNLGKAGEVEVYSHLFKNSFIPRFMVLEAAIFPMPVTGVYLKRNNRNFYDCATLEGDINIIESVTAGFEEPYALSLFIGDMVNFIKPGKRRKETNKGYMGYLVSFTSEHIMKNVIVQDRSLELEWKLKGERSFEEDRLSWSFRIGAKLHEHPEISSVAYLGLRRSNLSFGAPFLSWLNNSSFEVKLDVSLQDGNLVKQEYIVGKKYPFESLKIAYKFDIGAIWSSGHQYTGALGSTDHRDLLFVFRPNIEF